MKATATETPWSKTGHDGPWDTIVIGSGMGGMTAAAFLAKLGHRVLVLEQHYVAGGFNHTFKRKGYRWDVGVHAVGEVTEHAMPGRLLNHLTDGTLQWASLGPVYDQFHYPDGFRVDFPNSPKQYRDNLVEAFPNEVSAVERYIDYSREVAASMRGYYLGRALPRALAPIGSLVLERRARQLFQMRTRDVVAGLTDDEKLRSLLVAQWGYYGSPPSRSSFAIQALVVRHFLHGGFYPVGGSQQIARTLLQTVANASGWTRIRADVQEILVKRGRAQGVRLRDGEKIHAKRVISAAGAMATFSRLLPEDVRKESWAQSVGSLSPAPAHVCLYLGMRGDIRKAGASAANQWFYDTWDPEVAEWDVAPDREIPDAPVLYTSFPSLKDPAHDPGPEERHTGEVVTFVPWDTFEQWRDSRWMKRGEGYEAFKTQMQERLLSQILRRMPGLRDHIDYVELSTPLSTDHFCRPMRGSIYGIEPTPERFQNRWLRPHTPIRDLYLAGSEITSVGVIGAMMGGVQAAVAVEPIAATRILRGLR